MAHRDQSEDYCRSEDVIVFRDVPGQGIVGTRMTNEPIRLYPTNAQLIDAAEALLLQSQLRVVTISVEDLREQLILDRGIRFDDSAIAMIGYGLFDTSPVDIGKYHVTTHWLRTFRSFMDTRPSPFITLDLTKR